MSETADGFFNLDETMEAARRYRAVLDRRGGQVEAARNGRVGVAESPARIGMNAAYLMTKADEHGSGLPPELREDLERLAFPGAADPAAQSSLFLERTIGKTRDYLSFAFLEDGLIAGRTVGRVVISTELGSGFGTGFLVSPRLLLTNHHVLPDAETASLSSVEFDYEKGRDGRQKAPQSFEFSPDVFFLADRERDFALVALRDRTEGAGLAAFGFCRLLEQEGKILVGSPVNIIQHPNGEFKQLALRENRLVNLDNDIGPDLFAHYTTDTEPGSSGAPVFNDQWDVIALHHRGVPAMNKKGQLLAIDGRVWSPSDGPDRLRWIANEGIRVSRLVRFIREADLTGQQAIIRDEPFASMTVPPLTRAEGSDEGAGRATADESGRDQAQGDRESPASYRQAIDIPFRLTLALGEPVGAGHEGASIEGRIRFAHDVGAQDFRPRLEEMARPDPNWEGRKGFDPRFLGIDVPMPKPGAKLKGKLLTFGEGQTELKYHHYSVLMHKERRLAVVSAVNADFGAPCKSLREGKDRWFLDPRIPEEAQIGNAVYEGNSLDRGHLSRRADASWGFTDEEADNASNDTFHFTNCSPQHEVFNQPSLATRKGLMLWGGLEEHIARQSQTGVKKLCVFNGPIFGTRDRTYRDVVRLPKEFWKVIACRDDHGRLKSYAFLLSQLDLIRALPEEEIKPGPYAPFQIRLSDLQRRVGLSFGNLARRDALATVRTQEHLDPILGEAVVPIRALGDIVM